MEGKKYPPLQYIDFELEYLDNEGVIYESRWRVFIQRGGVWREFTTQTIRFVKKLIDNHPELERFCGTLGWINPTVPQE